MSKNECNCHPGSAIRAPALHPFFEELHALGEIFSKKNKDYSGTDDEYGNLRACERLGIPAWKGVIIRLQDKFTRLENGFRKNGEMAVVDETIQDTFRDIAVYAILGGLLYQKREGQRSET